LSTQLHHTQTPNSFPNDIPNSSTPNINNRPNHANNPSFQQSFQHQRPTTSPSTTQTTHLLSQPHTLDQQMTEAQKMQYMMNISQNLLQIQMQSLQSSTAIQDRLGSALDRSTSSNSDHISGKQRYNNLPPNIKLILRRMRVSNIYEPEPTEPTQTCMDIITSGNKSQSVSYVNTLLKNHRVYGRWEMGHINRFICIRPLWLEPDEPFGLTMLGVNCTGRPNPRKRQQEFEMQVRNNI
jgi:hypothetical protein